MFLSRFLIVFVLAVACATSALAQTAGTLPDSDALFKRAQAIRNNGQAQSVEAEQLLNRALDIRTRLLGSSDPRVAQIVNEIGKIYYNRGNFAKAEAQFRQALSIIQIAEDRESLDVGIVLGDVGAAVREQGRYQEAEDIVLKSLEIRRRQLPFGHPLIGASLNNLSRVYFSEHRYADAETALQGSLNIYRATSGPNDPLVRSGEALMQAIRSARGIDRYTPLAFLVSLFLAASYFAASLYSRICDARGARSSIAARVVSVASAILIALALIVFFIDVPAWIALRFSTDAFAEVMVLRWAGVPVGLWAATIFTQALDNWVRRMFGERTKPIEWFRRSARLWPEPEIPGGTASP